jgi:TolA-binding protein
MKLKLIILSLFTLMISGCLQTRAQVKKNSFENKEELQSNEKQSEIEQIQTELTRVIGKVEEIEHNLQNFNAGNMQAELNKMQNSIQELEKTQYLLVSELKALKDRLGLSQNQPQTSSATSINSNKAEDEQHFENAEAEFKNGNYKKAIVEYSKVQEKNPKFKKMPYVLYQIAKSFEKLNMKSEAQAFYNDLIEKYPKSPEAKKARQRK